MTFACSGDGEPLYWKPLLLSTRRSPRLRSVQRAVVLLFLLVSHCACGTSFLAGPERSMVTGGSSSTKSNNNNNKDIHSNNENNNKLHNYIHNTNGDGDNQQQQQQQHQRHSHLPYQQHSQQQIQQHSQLQQQLQHSLQTQSHYYYHQYKQPQSQTYPQQQHQPSQQTSPQQSQEQQKQQSSSPSQQQQPPQSQRQKRQDEYSDVRSPLWLQDSIETCTNSTIQQPPSPGPPAPSEEAPSQCLQIDHDFSKDICKVKTTERNREMRKARLAFCDSFLVYNMVNGLCRNPSSLSPHKCERCFEKLERLDAEVRDNYAVFEDILSRYDCETSFSTHWNCTHCKVAYKHWVCAMAFRFHTNGREGEEGEEVPPCRVYCEEVENKCPYFLPELHNQYAGEPSFLCRDSVRDRQNGFTPKQEGRCYKPCPTGNEICIQNATNTATHKEVTDSRTPNVTSGHNNDTSRARGERSRSSSAKSLQGSLQTLWLNLAAQLGLVLWSSRTLSLYWVIGLT